MRTLNNTQILKICLQKLEPYPIQHLGLSDLTGDCILCLEQYSSQSIMFCIVYNGKVIKLEEMCLYQLPGNMNKPINRFVKYYLNKDICVPMTEVEVGFCRKLIPKPNYQTIEFQTLELVESKLPEVQNYDNCFKYQVEEHKKRIENEKKEQEMTLAVIQTASTKE